MAIHTHIQMFLDGTPFEDILHFSLVEQVGGHTRLAVSIRGESIGDSPGGNSVLDRSRDFLGKRVALEITGLEGFGYGKTYFKGTITQVRGKKGKKGGGLGDSVDIVGHGNSILLDDGPDMNSFLDMGLSDIIGRLASNYPDQELKVVTKPENDPTIAYSVQNGQSTFAYLQYLAASNGEYLLYNRDRLYFGKPDLGDSIVLRYGTDLTDFSVGLETAPLKFNYFGNDYFSGTNAGATGGGTGTTGLTGMVSPISGRAYPKSSERFFSTYESGDLQQRMDTAADLQKKLAQQSQVSLYGESINTGVSLGRIVEVRNGSGSMGSYRVTQVAHTYTKGGRYKNTFHGVPMETDIYPLTDVSAVNGAQPQVAKVTDTHDPQGMSRVQVQFPWQAAHSQTTPWIRVATPYAGGDRGFLFLPEKGDEVLIGFENGEVERPFMQASLYTGVNKHGGWQSKDNDFKGMTTKGGHIIELNDTQNGESITITDKNNNTIHIDTVNNNIEISAMENMTFNAKNMEFNAAEAINVNAGTNMSTRVTETLSVNAKKSREMIKENKETVAKEILQNADKVRVESAKENMELVSTKMVDIQASDKIKLF